MFSCVCHRQICQLFSIELKRFYIVFESYVLFVECDTTFVGWSRFNCLKKTLHSLPFEDLFLISLFSSHQICFSFAFYKSKFFYLASNWKYCSLSTIDRQQILIKWNFIQLQNYMKLSKQFLYSFWRYACSLTTLKNKTSYHWTFTFIWK